MNLKLAKVFISFVLFIFSWNATWGQNVTLNKSKVSIPFQNFSDLIIVQVEVNGYENLNFILDTGSNGIIVFEDTFFSPEHLEVGSDVSVRGLGSSDYLTAKYVRENSVVLHKKYQIENAGIYYVKDSKFNLGAKFGTEIKGIIGNNAFRKYMLHLNYPKNRISISKKPIKQHKYKKTELKMYNDKPFVVMQSNDKHEYNLLMDSGGVDALWLFENEVDWQNVPHIRDFLGFGLSGEVIGNRIKKDSLIFENNWFEKVYIAIPDSIYVAHIGKIYEDRDGSVGGKFLKRFDWIIDYKNQELYYRPNRNFKKEFNYNALGFEVFQPIRELQIFVVESVLKGSLADEQGIEPDDVLESINGIDAGGLTLNQIYRILHQNTAKKMTITINRNGQRLYFDLPIRDILNGE